MSDIKLCKNCDFFRRAGEQCHHEHSRMVKVDYVNGEHVAMFAPAKWARSINGACTEAGLLYQEATPVIDNVVPFRRG